jgi:Fic family protein
MPGRHVSLVWPQDPTLYAPAKYRRACRYEAFVPEPLANLAFALDSRIAGVVSDAERAIRELNAVAHPALVPLAHLLLRSEAIASSKIEGMQVGARELARAEARIEAGGKVSHTAREVMANIEAMEVAVQQTASTAKIAVKNVVAIHRRLMANVPNARIAGQVRTEQNWIGGNDYTPCGADFVPPPPDRVDALLLDLCNAMNDDALPPVVQAALVHAQFETIHPFADGNGRTGRALIHVVLRRRSIAMAFVPPVSVVLAAARDRYIDGLSGFRGPHVGAWIEQFAAATATAADLARAYVGAVDSLMTRWRARLRTTTDPRADAAAWAVIDILPAHPILTASAAIAATGRAKAAVYQAIAQLVDAGVLVAVSQSRRNQVWEVAGLLDLLAGLEAGTPPKKRRRAARK